jgi:hypothetical protein
MSKIALSGNASGTGTLTAAIQELKAELDTTKARLAALENK